jgi:hypothetical protein
MPAVLPPPEERQKVDNAIEAAQAKKSRTANAKAATNAKVTNTKVTTAKAKKASAR